MFYFVLYVDNTETMEWGHILVFVSWYGEMSYMIDLEEAMKIALWDEVLQCGIGNSYIEAKISEMRNLLLGLRNVN